MSKDNNENDIFRRTNRCDLLGPVYLGSSLDQTGQLNFFNSSSINTTAFQAGNATAAVTYTLPTAGPAGNGYALVSTTVGVMSWLNAATTYAPVGAAFVTIGNDATLTADRALTGTTNQVVITDNGANSTVVLSLPQNINVAATPTFASETLTATTNQLVLGTTRTATITAPTPATTSRVYTFPDQSADYSVVASQGTQTVSGTKTFDGQLIGKGTATNDNAASGYIGEYSSSSVTQANAVSIPTTQFIDVTSISLTAGDWDVSGIVGITPLTPLTGTQFGGGIGTATGNSSTGLVQGDTFIVSATTPTSNDDVSMSFPTVRKSLSGTTTIYLKATATFAVGSAGGYGRISARRMR